MSKYLYLLSKNQFKIVFFGFVVIVVYLESSSLDFQHFDKIKHIIVFFLLSFLLNRSSSDTSKRIRNIVALFMFGVFIEFLQLFMPDRQVSRGDLLANLIGILLFQITYSLLKFWQKKRHEKTS
jgi:VanZ family protein